MGTRSTHALAMRVLTVALIVLSQVAWAGPQDQWDRSQVNWRAGAGRRIKEIRFPKGHKPPTLGRSKTASRPELKTAAPQANGTRSLDYALDVNGPPLDGFVPYVAIVPTKARKAELEMDAEVESSIRGQYPSGFDPKTQYAIGIFDTGASGHVMGYQAATRMGLFSNRLITSNQTTISGVIGSVSAWVSQPLALFITGLGDVSPETQVLSTSRMMGESNISIIVGDQPVDVPDLVTAIGSPMSVYFTAHIRNDRPVAISRDGQEYSGPSVEIYVSGDPCAPTYPNRIPLELRPLGAYNVQYMPSMDMGGLGDLGDILGGGFETDFSPASPSVIMGNLSQSLFFIHSVDLYDGARVALDKGRFMLDTGAQVSVIGSRIAARLGLDPSQGEFQVEIQDVTGEFTMAPGFYVDSLQIPALGQWLTATNVPVVLLDVSSPEGGKLDGIIGTNLLLGFNVIVRGGGMFLLDDPWLELAPINTPRP